MAGPWHDQNLSALGPISPGDSLTSGQTVSTAHLWSTQEPLLLITSREQAWMRLGEVQGNHHIPHSSTYCLPPLTAHGYFHGVSADPESGRDDNCDRWLFLRLLLGG